MVRASKFQNLLPKLTIMKTLTTKRKVPVKKVVTAATAAMMGLKLVLNMMILPEG
jgi:hypothetical protein